MVWRLKRMGFTVVTQAELTQMLGTETKWRH